MGQTITNSRPVAMIAFEKAMYQMWNRSCEVSTALSQYGSKEMDTDMLTQRFAVEGTTGAPTRHYGDELPREFANCDDAPTQAYSEVDLLWSVAPARIAYDLLQLNKGFMGSPVEFTLNNLVKDVKFEAERNLCSGVGNDVIANFNGAVTDNLDGTFTVLVWNYGGVAGQQLGQLMEALLLESTPIHAARAVGDPPGNLLAVKITSVVATVGAESITMDGDPTDFANTGVASDNTWVFYRGRNDAAGVQGATDAPYGLPYLVSDWVDYAAFQVTVQADAPRFESQVIRSPGVPLGINEQLFNRMSGLSEVAVPQDPGNGKPAVMNGFYLLHTFNVNGYALSLQKDRRFMTPPIRKAGASGYAKKYLTFNDEPIVGAHMAQRNSAYKVIADRLFWRKNGPMWGQFMAIGGQTKFAVPCSPDQEVRWVRSGQCCTHGRAGMVRADNIQPFFPEAA